MMLRSRYRAVTSKQPLTASQPSSHTDIQTRRRSKTPTFLDSPIFRAFTRKKGVCDRNDGVEMSPTSILNARPFISLPNKVLGTGPPPLPRVVSAGSKRRSWEDEAKGIVLLLNAPIDPNEVCNNNFQPENFLSFCHTCKKNLQQNIDIYIYRGEMAFCSEECRHQEMILDGMEIEEAGD